MALRRTVNEIERNQDFIKTLVLSMFFLHFLLLAGCSTTRELTVDPSRMPEMTTGRITSLTMQRGDVVTFDRDGGKYIEQPTGKKLYRSVVGVTREGNTVEIDPDSVVVIRMEVERTNVFGTILLVLAASSVLFVIVLLEALSHIH